METHSQLLATVLGVLVLAAITTTVLWLFRVPARWAPLLAIVRGAVQLAAISLILSGVIREPRWIALALLVMFLIATTVATRRIGWSWGTAVKLGASIAAGAGVATTVVFTSGALQLNSRYALALGAIVIGNAMSIAALTGRMFNKSLNSNWDEVEGWLALGATPRRATVHLARQTVRDALIPSIDQTKTTGLVVLPGAFVGAIFGGISPLEAGRFQIVVLAGLMAAGSITSVLVAQALGGVRVKPTELR